MSDIYPEYADLDDIPWVERDRHIYAKHEQRKGSYLYHPFEPIYFEPWRIVEVKGKTIVIRDPDIDRCYGRYPRRLRRINRGDIEQEGKAYLAALRPLHKEWLFTYQRASEEYGDRFIGERQANLLLARWTYRELGRPEWGKFQSGALRAFGLPPNATKGEVKQAYKRNVLQVHPDAGGSHEAFLNLQTLYETALREALDDEYNQEVNR